MSYFRSINQQVQVATVDTSNLAVGQTFSGSSYSTLGVNAIQVNLKADQNCSVYIDQGPDGTNWYINDLINYYNGTGGQGWTTQATDSSARVRVTNTGTAATTTKVLSMVLCPIVEALPRALSTEGNLKTDVQGIWGDFGVEADIGPMRDLKMTKSVRLIGTSFSGSVLDPNFWTTSATGSGTATVSSGELTLADGATASSTVKLQSVRRARYVPGNANYFRSNVTLPVQTGACIRRWGAYDSIDGYYFQYDGTNLACGSRRSSVDSTVSSGSFVGQWGSGYSVDTNCHTYQIYWTNKKAYFTVDDEPLHTISGTTSTLVSTPHLLVGLECNNGTGNTANNQMKVRSSSIFRLGEVETAPQWTDATSMSASAIVLKYGPGRLQQVVVNQLSGNAADRLTLYDGTTAVNTIAAFATNSTTSISSLTYKLDFYNGLSYVFNGTGGTPNATIVYE